ncbi:hypothetical protein Ade02nite_08860 [Paractinoplanes deccanensis]|uniref:Uncharacterized protein n=1 Tax=Paractinoplanes deccanensis TaxID=113561 RepID=A0ABQ3XX12_9ACTN|nr:hypothetical protein Ade02nite_08860 [Actinoplanes deccanensis]
MDAVAMAQAARSLEVDHLCRPRQAGERTALRVLAAAREQMSGERTQAVNALTALLRTVDLGVDARRALTTYPGRAMSDASSERSFGGFPTAKLIMSRRCADVPMRVRAVAARVFWNRQLSSRMRVESVRSFPLRGRVMKPLALGPYPLCPSCRLINGGLIAVSHRQVHLRAHGKEACVDRGIAGLLACLWAVCDTRSCCENDGGKAYVVPTADTCDAAVRMLADLGLDPEVTDGVVSFQERGTLRLDSVEHVRRRLQGRSGIMTIWRVNGSGVFERSSPVDGSGE